MAAEPPKVTLRYLLLECLVKFRSPVSVFPLIHIPICHTFLYTLVSNHSLFLLHITCHCFAMIRFYSASSRHYATYSRKFRNPAALDIALYMLLSGAFLAHLGLILREDLGVIVSKLSTIGPTLQSRQSEFILNKSSHGEKTANQHLLTALRL